MSIKHNIGFADIIVLEDDLAEVVVNKNTEITLAMVHQLHQTLLDNLTAPFFLLVNKINNYSYDFEAMHELGSIKELKGIAIIHYSEKSKKNAQYLASLSRKIAWNAKTFNRRNDGLDWISNQK